MFAPTQSKNGKAVPILIGVIAFIVLIAAVVFLKGGRFAKLEALPVAQYLEGPTDFLGNEYALKAQIDSQLKWDKAIGRLVAVNVESGRHRLPVFVPAKIEQNLQTGQRYEMHVRVETGGLIYVEALRKY